MMRACVRCAIGLLAGLVLAAVVRAEPGAAPDSMTVAEVAIERLAEGVASESPALSAFLGSYRETPWGDAWDSPGYEALAIELEGLRPRVESLASALAESDAPLVDHSQGSHHRLVVRTLGVDAARLSHLGRLPESVERITAIYRICDQSFGVDSIHFLVAGALMRLADGAVHDLLTFNEVLSREEGEALAAVMRSLRASLPGEARAVASAEIDQAQAIDTPRKIAGVCEGWLVWSVEHGHASDPEVEIEDELRRIAAWVDQGSIDERLRVFEEEASFVLENWALPDAEFRAQLLARGWQPQPDGPLAALALEPPFAETFGVPPDEVDGLRERLGDDAPRVIGEVVEVHATALSLVTGYHHFQERWSGDLEFMVGRVERAIERER